MRSSPAQVAFSAGEIDPLLHRRFDYQRYQTGLATCRGFIPMAQGGFTRAPGTLHRGASRGNATGVLVPFVFAADDAVVLEFTPLRMRVWRYGALVMSGGSPYELVTPYNAADLPRLRWVQSADVVYLCDGARPIQRLARLALNSWTMTAQTFEGGPLRVQNLDEALTVQASAATGSITLTASAALFQAGHVGSLFQLTPVDFTQVNQWLSNEALSIGDRRRVGDRVYELVAGTGSGAVQPVHTEGTARMDRNVEWLYLYDNIGLVQITAVASGTSATATVLRRIPQECVADPTYRWSEGAWSSLYGYPSAVEIYDQRLVAAASQAEPRTVWFSAVGGFNDFTPGVEADSSFAYTLAGSGSVNRIVNIARGRSGLHLLALGEEHSARAESRAQVIGPTTAVFDIDGSVGSSDARPIAPGGDPILIARDGRRVMGIRYSLQDDANRVLSLSRASQHLGAEGFRQIVWQASPEPMAWLRRGTGDLAVMIYDEPEEVLGWCTVPVAGGVVEAMCVTPSATGTDDVVTLLVRRQINGATVRLIEEVAPIWGMLVGNPDILDACHFYAAAQFTVDPAQDTFSVPHLVGETVYAWTDAGDYGPLTVAGDGTVTLPDAVTRATIGLYDATHMAETLDVTAAAPDGNSMGRPKRFTRVALGVHRTAQGFAQVVERDFAQAPRVLSAQAIVQVGVAASLTEAFSGVVRLPLPTGHAREVAVRITPYTGAPLTVTAIVPTIQEAGG